jgi:hypothetical protein
MDLTFHADLYDEAALRSAAEVYSKVAICTVVPGPEYHRVALSAKGTVPENRIADELGNYALGVTIEQRKGLVRPDVGRR